MEKIGKIQQVGQLKKLVPGEGAFEEVSLEAGSEEFLRQEPTTKAMMDKAIDLNERMAEEERKVKMN